ncbi:MAG TPA: thioredoxin family protein [Polyangiaceae bacterium]|jgi:predicted dithiol-disulfide oxidoreductase (DUF899 family)
MSLDDHAKVTQAQWLEARKAFLKKEKDFTRMRDELSAARRALPWVKVEKRYEFDTTKGKRSLGDLFDGQSQLVVYHFMFDPSWEAGCKSCSFWADNFERNVVHLAHRDVKMMAISRAPLAKLLAFQKRLGWTFEWASSFENDFNYDFGASFTPEEVASGKVEYNFVKQKAWGTETPGISVFYKDARGDVYRTYSTYSRGLDMMNAAYHYLDLVPKGRDEGDGNMTWLRLRDSYDE